ncbi:MAG: IPT/TIG domain-containing protein [Hymenobacteraceae bacterium]|nr:IPT/TIG domain-containing protein [Hymenobacteraceae bacterium]
MLTASLPLRRRLALLLVVLLSTTLLTASAQTWPWAARAGGSGNMTFCKTAVDAAGNAYVAGRFTGTITCGTQTLTSPRAGVDWGLFVGKVSASGQWQWAKTAGRAGAYAFANGVAVDRAGNVYVGGFLSAGTYAFDAVPLTITSVGCATYAFLGKLSASGQWQWVKGANTGSSINDVVVDPAGNVCAVGITRSTGMFGSVLGPPPYGNYAFATKLSGVGTVLWEAAALVNGAADDVAVDRAGNFYLGGYCSGAVTIGTTVLPGRGRDDGFVAKLSGAGQWQWAQRLGSTSDDAVNDVAVDATGNVYTTAYFNGAATIGTTAFAAASGGYGVIAKCSPTGQWLWAVRPQPLTTADGQWPTSIAIDATGSLHVMGINRGSVRYGATTLTTAAYLARLNAATGAWQWAQGLGLSADGSSQALAVGPAGGLWMSGFHVPTLRLGTLTLPGNATGTNIGVVGRMAFAPPTLTALSAASGAVGSTLTLTGTNLSTTATVKFGTRVAAYTVVSATRLTVTVPAGAITGLISVTNTGGSATSATTFTVVPPAVSSFSPASGPVGQTVTITGTGFSGATGVKFNATPAVSFTVVSATRITAVVPPGATTGRVSVLALGGTKLSATSFSVTAVRPAPIVATTLPFPAPPLADAFSLYPNPAREAVRVLVPAGARQIDVFDGNGLLVRRESLASGATEATVSLAGLRAGRYTVRCGALTRRLVVE